MTMGTMMVVEEVMEVKLEMVSRQEDRPDW